MSNYINKVAHRYTKAFLKGARNASTPWTLGMHTSKRFIKNKRILASLKRWATGLIGPFMWPNVFPTSLDPGAGSLLYSLVRLYQPDVILEIGTFKGYSAICLAQALKDNKKGILITIDPVQQGIVHQAMKQSGLRRRIRYLVGTSFGIIPFLNLPKLDIVFIDGNHSYKHCLEDFNLVKNLVVPGGLIVFHDTVALPGPKKVIIEIKEESEFEVVTLPTITGIDDEGEVVLKDNLEKGYRPLGITICKKHEN